MALTTGPLFSMDASGTVAGSIVFSKWKGRSYVRRHAVPSNPRTAMQVSVRAMMAFLARQWADAHVISTQSTFALEAAARSISPFNLYVHQNQLLWRQWKTPGASWNPPGTGTAPSAPGLAVTGGTNEATLVITAGANPADWGFIVYRALSSPVSPTISKAIAVIPEDGLGGATWVDTPLAPGTYYYQVMPFMLTGLQGTLSLEDSDIVV